MLALRLPDVIEIRLEKLSKRTGRTKSFYAREAIIEHLEELEEIYLAEKELEDIKKGAKTWTLNEMCQHRCWTAGNRRKKLQVLCISKAFKRRGLGILFTIYMGILFTILL